MQKVLIQKLRLSNAESVDPEAEASDAENDSRRVVENPDPCGDLPEDEFIADDEDFVIQEVKSKIKIFEEEVIPEHKVYGKRKRSS